MRLHLAIAIALVVACSDRAEDSGVCHDGDRMLGRDRCNDCSCSHGQWGTTEKACGFGIEPGTASICYPWGVGDATPETPGLQPWCNVISELPQPSGGIVEAPIPECTRTSNGFEMPAADIDACWFGRTDTTHTGEPFDDVSFACLEMRPDLEAAEIEVLRRPGTAEEQASYKVTCAGPQPNCPGPELGTST